MREVILIFCEFFDRVPSTLLAIYACYERLMLYSPSVAMHSPPRMIV